MANIRVIKSQEEYECMDCKKPFTDFSVAMKHKCGKKKMYPFPKGEIEMGK